MGILRVVLALCVVVGHTGPLGGRLSFLPGNAAVQMFYMISGFYMALILHEKYGTSEQGTRLFYSNRLLRIFPPYFVVLVLTIAFSGGARLAGVVPDDAAQFWLRGHRNFTPATWLALVVPNLLIFGQDTLLFFGLNAHSGQLYWTPAFWREPLAAWRFLMIPQAWSIGVELLFYVIAPFLVRRSMRVILGVMCLSFLVRLVLAWKAGWVSDPWNYRFFPSEVSTFLIGVVGYRAYDWLRKSERLPNRAWGLWCLGALLLIIVTLPRVLAPRAVLGTVYLMTMVSIPLIFHATRKMEIDRQIGELSYPIYLVHVLMITIVSSLHLGGPMVSLLFSVGAAWLLQFFVDHPIDRYRELRIARNAALNMGLNRSRP